MAKASQNYFEALFYLTIKNEQKQKNIFQLFVFIPDFLRKFRFSLRLPTKTAGKFHFIKTYEILMKRQYDKGIKHFFTGLFFPR